MSTAKPERRCLQCGRPEEPDAGYGIRGWNAREKRLEPFGWLCFACLDRLYSMERQHVDAAAKD